MLGIGGMLIIKQGEQISVTPPENTPIVEVPTATPTAIPIPPTNTPIPEPTATSTQVVQPTPTDELVVVSTPEIEAPKPVEGDGAIELPPVAESKPVEGDGAAELPPPVTVEPVSDAIPKSGGILFSENNVFLAFAGLITLLIIIGFGSYKNSRRFDF
jgi:hypothetical protein